MESFYTMNGRGDGNALLRIEQEGCNCSSTNANNGMTFILLRTERNGTERNDLAEGPRAFYISERNYFKKVGTCPSLTTSLKRRINLGFINRGLSYD